MRTLDMTLNGSLQPLVDFSWVWRWAQQMRLMPASSFKAVDGPTIEMLLDALVDYGLPELFLYRFQLRARTRLSALFWSEVRGAILRAPLPGLLAWVPLRELFDDAALVPITGVRPTSLWRYVSGRRATPEPTLLQLHELNVLLCDLSLQLPETAARQWLKADQSGWLLTWVQDQCADGQLVVDQARVQALVGDSRWAAPLRAVEQIFLPYAERHPGYDLLLQAVSSPSAFAAPLAPPAHSGAIESLLGVVMAPAPRRAPTLLLETA